MASLQVGESRFRGGVTQIRHRRAPASIGIPALLVAVAVLLPLAYLVLRTFELGDDAWRFLINGRNLNIVWNSMLLVVSVVGSAVLLAVPLAWLTVRSDLPFKKFWSVVTVLPLVLPSYIGAYLFVLMLGEKGMVQQLLEPLGVDRLPGIYGFGGAWLVLTLLCYPYVLLSVRAALWRMDPALEHSAQLLGHGPFMTFCKVTLPLLRPAMLSGSLLVALYVLSDFGAVSFLNYKTFTWAIYLKYGTISRSLAAALSLVLVALTVVLLLLELRARGRSAYFRSDGQGSSTVHTVFLKQWRWPAFAGCLLLAGASLLLPLTVLATWVVTGFAAGESFQTLWLPSWHSLMVSALAAFGVVLAALPVALLAVRYPSWWSVVIERLCYIGFALPGIALSLALAFFAVRFAFPLYQSLPLLVFAYGVMFLPAGIGAIRSALLQINPNLEFAARGLGHKPIRVMWHVYVPLIRSGLVAGGALVFLLSMKELPATLILGPTGFDTLATAIWSHLTEGFYAGAALPSLLLVLVSSGSMAFILRWDGRFSK